MRSLLFTLSVILSTTPLAAESILFSGVDGDGRAAEALFETDGTNLTVTLMNTSTIDVRQPIFVLTGLFFDTLTPWSLNTGGAILGPQASSLAGLGASRSSTVKQGSGEVRPGNNDLSSEWAYRSDLAGTGAAAPYGISSTGLDDVFGPDDRFDTSTNLEGPDSPNGLQYGITTLNDRSRNDNGGVAHSSLVKNSVVFTFTNIGVSPLNLHEISKIVFQYGTSKSEPVIFALGTDDRVRAPAPEPTSAALFGIGALVSTGFIRRKRAAKVA